MYILRIGKLLDGLKYDTIAEPKKFNYFFSIIFLMVIGILRTNWMQEVYTYFYDLLNMGIVQAGHKDLVIPIYNYLDRMFDITVSVIVLCGIIICYQINKRGDNKYFIDRFVCLSIPLFIRAAWIFFLSYLTTLIVTLGFMTAKLLVAAKVPVNKLIVESIAAPLIKKGLEPVSAALSKDIGIFEQLSQAQGVIENFDRLSFWMHISACICSILVFAVFFTWMIWSFKIIASKEKSCSINKA
ncbi:MAG: hypothetical protein UR26_C0006G0049 [candidate division TM6 bacterium GW2011_GWF2_32_72]|nr:MAG: hypothetical protein UR26_C0006G0049 [candidate division TM6 bacterium GW2011_GWF2_32_72]